MAFLEHIDPGNSGGSVLIPETSHRLEFTPVVYTCLLCDAVFSNSESRQAHRIAEHPIKRPLLLIDGQPLRKDNIVVRTKIAPESIEFIDVDTVHINKKLIEDHQQAIQYLCESTPAIFQLRLANQTYPVEYSWDINIADPNELDDVDELFYSTFNLGLSINEAFSTFNARVRQKKSAARNYAAGLSCYVTAVMTKDQLPGATLDYDKFVHKLGEAMDILSDYKQRPLTDAIISIAEFMQNDFSLLMADNRLPKLGVTKQFFNSGVFIETISVVNDKRSIPIDDTTDSIVIFCSSSEAYKVSHVQELETLQKAKKIGSKDKLKVIFVLWCFHRVDTCNNENVDILRRKLIHNPYFGGLVNAIERAE
jgi:hypothetical protein